MRVLLVHPAYLGDAVFLGPAVRALKARWPAGQVTLVVTPRGAPAARLLPGCDQVVVYDKRSADRGPIGLWRLGRRLRLGAFDLALVVHPSLRSGLLAWLSGAPRRIGYAPFCTERLEIDRSRPFVDRSLRLAERAGATGEPGLALAAPAELAPYAERILAGARRPILGVVPGAQWATKRWEPARWVELLRRLGGTPVLLGSPGERGLAAAIAAGLDGAARDATGNAVEEAVALLARCDLVLGGDTGLVHCARALGRPTLVLFGPTSPARHRLLAAERAVSLSLDCQPCHDHGPRTCPRGRRACLDDLSAGAVEEAARSLLDPGSR